MIVGVAKTLMPTGTRVKNLSRAPGQVPKQVFTCIIHGYLTTHYLLNMDTDLMIPVPMGIHIR